MHPQFSAGRTLKLMNRTGRRRRLISLTPLIDVVFILLLFFMLASSYLDWRTIHLNAPASAAAGSTAEAALLVEIRDGGLRLSGEAVTRNDLAMRLAERIERKPDQRVLVRPEDGVSLQDAVTVLDLISAAGVSDLSLIRDMSR